MYPERKFFYYMTFPESHIINPLLTKFVRSRWLNIGLILFLRVYGLRRQLLFFTVCTISYVAFVCILYSHAVQEISICNRMGPKAIKDYFHEYFKSFHKIRDEGNLENFENTSEINP